LIVRRGRELIDDLVEIGRDDLGIITDKLNRKLKLTR